MKRFSLFRPALVSSLAIALIGLHPTQASAQQPSEFRILHTWTIGGEGGWDYMAEDTTHHHLYLTHNATVEVVDLGTGQKIGAITGLAGTHGVALSPDGRYGFISDGKANNVVVFDRQSLAKIKTIPAGSNPDGIVYEPVTKTVWAFNGHSNNATVIDATTFAVVTTIPLPGKPEFPVADGKGAVFANIESGNEIATMDAHTQKVIGLIPLPGCESPSGLSIDRMRSLLFSVCDGGVMAIANASTAKLVATAPIGEGPDADRFDARRKLAFSSNGGSGNMTIMDVSGMKPKVIQTLPTASGARTMTLDETTGHVYTVSAKFARQTQSDAAAHHRPTALPGTFFVLDIGTK